MKIVASNDINEKVLTSLNNQVNAILVSDPIVFVLIYYFPHLPSHQKHEIDVFGIGTNLVTCQAQPALGMVYKLAEIKGRPTMKLSQEIGKTSIPARKSVYRIYTKLKEPVVDLLLVRIYLINCVTDASFIREAIACSQQ